MTQAEKVCKFIALLIGLLVFGSVICYGAGHTQKQTVVVFPFAISNSIPASKTELIKQYADDLLTLLNEGLRETRQFSVLVFDPRVASIRRAITEQKLTEKEVSQPIDTTAEGAARAQKIAKLIGADVAMIGSVEEYSFNESSGEVTLTVSTQIIQVQEGDIEPIVVTGRSKKTQDRPDQSEEALGVSATYDVAEKILANLASVTSAENSTLTPVKSPKSKSLVPALLGAMLLGYLLSGG